MTVSTEPTALGRYGGAATVRRIVMDFYERALESDMIGPFFETIDMARLIDHQTTFVSFVLGGPASVSNARLRAAHARLGAGHVEFDEVKRLLAATLEDAGMTEADRMMVLEAVERRRHLIVAS